MKTQLHITIRAGLALISAFSLQLSAFAQGTAFTYQGRLETGGAAYTGLAGMQFSLWTTNAGGSQLGSTVVVEPVGVTNGLFTVALDFGNQFPGANRWLELAVRTNLLGFITLSPRQLITATPYALTASNLSGTLPATQLSGTLADARLSANVSVLGQSIESAEITDGTIVNADLSASAAIADTKLATIASAGKVANTATTATSANTANAIVARDASGNFAAGTVTAVFSGNGAGVTNVNAAKVGGLDAGAFWQRAGNAGTTPGADFIGTTDTKPLEFRVDNQRVMRIDVSAGPPNIISGWLQNSVGNGTYGAVIAGGGQMGYYHTIGTNSHQSVIGGGYGNHISDKSSVSVIAGGSSNDIGRDSGGSAIGGGWLNIISDNSRESVISGGLNNEIGTNSGYSTIGGGRGNHITNNAEYATIPGGRDNTATNYAFAAGYRAKANHFGSFVWADSHSADFASTANNQFNVRAFGGVRLETSGAGMTLDGQPVLAGTVTSAQMADNSITTAKILDGTIGAADVNAASFDATFWRVGGNAGTSPGTHFLGTTDNQPLELKINGMRALRLEDNGDSSDSGTIPDGAPNLIGGSSVNAAAAGVVGVTIAGGGATNYYGAGGANLASADYATIGGGVGNRVETGSYSATVAGGRINTVGPSAGYSAIGGGYDNAVAADSMYATIAGGRSNDAGTNSDYSTISGGYLNRVAQSSGYTTIAGGYANDVLASSGYASIGGGYNNNVAGGTSYATIAGGYLNDIGMDAEAGTIAGGRENKVLDTAWEGSVGGGYQNIAGNLYATVPGGYRNEANGFYSFAAGRQAKANAQGAFVWGDSTAADVVSTTANSVTMRAAGGYRLFSNAGATAGVSLAAGGTSWGVISDRNVKKDFAPVDGVEVLEKLAALPVTQWHYNWETGDTTPHIGPMAQDFKAAFYPGADDKVITTQEADGVALAAIQGLNEKVEVRSQKSEVRIQKLEAENAELKERLEKLELLLNAKSEGAQ